MCNKKDICVVIPVYKQKITENERKNIKNTIQKLNSLDIFFVTYKGSHIKTYKEFEGAGFKLFDQKFFKNIEGYNKLLMSLQFYRSFFSYDYMLIVQTDAYIIKDLADLKRLVKKGYDYWGAPWVTGYEVYRFLFNDYETWLRGFPILKWLFLGKKREVFVGNGGLSLRRIKKTYFLLLQKWLYVKSWEGNEDLFFAVHGRKNLCLYKVAAVEDAETFSLEVNMRKKIRKGEIPFGIHGWEKYYPNLFEEQSF